MKRYEMIFLYIAILLASAWTAYNIRECSEQRARQIRGVKL